MLLQAIDFLYAVTEKAVAAFNFLEAIFWITVSAGFAAAVLRAVSRRMRTLLLATVLLFAFGVSDFFEVTSGAWWRPWWLLAWKGACLISLVWLYFSHRLAERRVARAAALYWTG